MRIFSLVSGSSGNSYLFLNRREAVLIDAGLSLRSLKMKLAELGLQDISILGIFISHEHSDHVKGLEAIANHFKASIFITNGTKGALESKMRHPEKQKWRIIAAQSEIDLAGFAVKSVAISHDATEPVAFTVSCGGLKVAVVSDTGVITPEWEILADTEKFDIFFLEANYDQEMLLGGSYSYPLKMRIMSDRGHLSNSQTAEFLYRLYNNGCCNFVLTHLSLNNNFPELAMLVVRSYFAQAGINVGDQVEVFCAPRYDTMEYKINEKGKLCFED